MASMTSKKAIFAALAGNAAIFVTKMGAGIYTGSSAMFSEAIHSFVDTGNQGLLLFGIKRAGRDADAAHPFGYGKELYFWTFIVAILIFAGGAGISIYEGIHKVMDPTPLNDPFINYIVLGFAMIFEGFAWWVAWKAFKAGDLSKPSTGGSVVKAVRDSKDPTVFTILFEDTAAMAGLIIAFVGIYCAQAFDMPMLDGVASILIGCVLALTAVFLAVESKGLLVGEAANPATVKAMTELLAGYDGVEAVNELLTLHFGPTDVLVNASLDFCDTATADKVEATVTEAEKAIKERWPEVSRVFIEIQG